MHKLLTAALGATLLGLAGCSTAPVPTRIAEPVAPPAPPPSPYIWTQGNAARAAEEMQAAFGTDTLAPGAYVWAAAIPAKGETRILVDRYKQLTYVYRDDQLVGVATVSSGKDGKETPLGFWTILEKKRFARSRKYDNAPMPFMQRIDEYGIAFHGGANPGFPASHGCVRLPMKFAEKLFGLTAIGSKVIIEG